MMKIDVYYIGTPSTITESAFILRRLYGGGMKLEAVISADKLEKHINGADVYTYEEILKMDTPLHIRFIKGHYKATGRKITALRKYASPKTFLKKVEELFGS